MFRRFDAELRRVGAAQGLVFQQGLKSKQAASDESEMETVGCSDISVHGIAGPRASTNDVGSWMLMLKIGEEYTFPKQPPGYSWRGYMCSMEQGPNFRHSQYFEALNARWSRGKGLDATCKWIAREDGIYFSTDGSPLLKRYEWNGPLLLKN
ncbi:hypothetical protein YC2023_124564 [Brassica napus]